MVRVELEQLYKKLSCREFNSLQDCTISKKIYKVLYRRLPAGKCVCLVASDSVSAAIIIDWSHHFPAAAVRAKLY